MAFEEAVSAINADFFFREFTFSSNTFRPNPNRELELADKLIALNDFMIVQQLKERNPPPNTSAEIEQKWFEKSIVGKATSQIRDSVSYLSKYENVELSNDRGHLFNISKTEIKRIHKLVVYRPHKLLPLQCSSQKFHLSKTVGVIHLLSSDSYSEILGTLVTPVEIEEYLGFREKLALRWGRRLSGVKERALLGQYIRNLPDEIPSEGFMRYVDELDQKGQSWDIARIIHLFQDRVYTTHSSTDGNYKVLRELASLYRTDMAEFKKRFAFSMQKAFADEGCLPHRFSTSRNRGFLFIPLKREDLSHRRNLHVNFTVLNKYDQKLDCCVGLTFIAEELGGWCDVQWFTLESPWEEDALLQEQLDAHYPFRPVKTVVKERYGLLEAKS
jgi:hypothetical protein